MPHPEVSKEVTKLINEKALLSTLDNKDFTVLKRLKEIDGEIQEQIIHEIAVRNGKKGGSSTSPKKAKSSRENGKKNKNHV